MNGEENNTVVTSVATPVDFVLDGWVVLEADRLWSDMKWRLSTDDRRTNMSFKSTGYVLVAVPTRDDPPEPPTDVEGLRVITLEEYLYAIFAITEANERIRRKTIETIENQF